MKDKPKMSVRSQWGEFCIVPVEVLESDLSPRATLVFIALMSRVDHKRDGESVCWPSYDAIKSRCAVKGREAISAALDELEQKGYLRRERRFSASTVYTLLRPPVIASSSESERMDSAPVVRNPNDSSSESERQKFGIRTLTRSTEPESREQESVSPARASRGGGADAEHAPFVDQPKVQIPEQQHAEAATTGNPSKSSKGSPDHSGGVNKKVDATAPTPIPEQPRADSTLADEPVTPNPEAAKRVRKVQRALSEHEAARHRELFDGLVAVCVVDAKLMGGRIARTAKQLREGDPTAVRATMDEFLAWWKTSDFRGQRGKPPTLDQVVTSWKLFRENYGERPAAKTTDKAQKGAQYIDRLARIYTEVIDDGQ